MPTILPLTLLLLLSAPPPSPPDLRLLPLQVELARGEEVYLVLAPNSLRAYLKGMELKRWPLQRPLQVPEAPRVSRLRERIPAPPRVLVSAEEVFADPLGEVRSPDEIVGVEDMPAEFYLVWEDGSLWYVYGGDSWWAPTHWPKALLRARFAWRCLRTRLRQPSTPCLILELPPASARSLYWLLGDRIPALF